MNVKCYHYVLIETIKLFVDQYYGDLRYSLRTPVFMLILICNPKVVNCVIIKTGQGESY